MRTLFVSPEAYPLIKVGGLGDVSYALPTALRRLGEDVRLLLPGYRPVLDGLELRPLPLEIAYAPGQTPARLLEGQLEPGGLPVYVVDCPALYLRDGGPYLDHLGRDWDDNALRFGVLCKAAAQLGSPNPVFQPELIHCNDWPTGLVPAYLSTQRERPKVVMSIHNMAHQGLFTRAVVPQLGLPPQGFNISGYEFNGLVSFLKAGLFYSDWITTVSPTYAEEIQTSVYGCGLHGLLRQRRHQFSGILNGIDDAWNPASDPHLDTRYDAAGLDLKQRNKAALCRRFGLDPDPNIPLLGLIARITHQKGIDLLLPLLPELLDSGVQVVMLGLGERELEFKLERLAAEYRQRFHLELGYDEALSHQIEAGVDLFLMPSRFEPCGLNQMYSMRYGTLPLVRRTGGLADTVTDTEYASLNSGEATGFVFDEADPDQLWACLQRALLLFRDRPSWREVQRNAMNRDFGWEHSAREYQALYHRLQHARPA